MRRLPKRKKLPPPLLLRLAQETSAIEAHQNPKAEADRRFKNARGAIWFRPVVEALIRLSGPGRRCMYCSDSEASDVEHIRPKAVFPNLAMSWENTLWVCTTCNRFKGHRYPPDTEPGAEILNPLVDDVWKYFFIDRHGFLVPLWDAASDAFDARAAQTRDRLELNRQGVQEARAIRLRDLKTQVAGLLKMHKKSHLSKAELNKRVRQLKRQPFHPEVADFFLSGPGSATAPFRTLLALL